MKGLISEAISDMDTTCHKYLEPESFGKRDMDLKSQIRLRWKERKAVNQRTVSSGEKTAQTTGGGPKFGR